MPRVTSNPMLPTPKEEQFKYGDWTISVRKCHIMGSKCANPSTCSSGDMSNSCTFCSFDSTLKLHSLPDMVFPDNSLIISHKNGGSVEFTALGALKCIKDKADDNIEVAHAKLWKEARSGCQYLNTPVKNFDWTYTSDYRGCVKDPLKVVESEEKIDLDKLRAREEIKFYNELYLYEDELDDNGCTKCVVKVRVMPSGFFVVFRHYLRVDHVIIRVHDTRLYHSEGTDYIIRESSIREKNMEHLNIDPTIYKNPDLVWEHLSLVKETTEKIV